MKPKPKLTRETGANVSISLKETKMPVHFPDDPHSVKLLLAESERMSKHGNAWLTAPVPNAVAGEIALRYGWAYALAAVWLRCKLKGEFLPESKDSKPMRTKPEIAAEIAALKALKPYGSFKARTTASIRCAIIELEEGHDMNDAEWDELSESERDIAQQALLWKEGTIDDKPSEGWGPLVE